ncbi:MAG TPA: hypothetical protein VNZ86_07420, partial [Bacteroidia bacterium]|nr:hypothetical protein [Bacteroidia bacterium]
MKARSLLLSIASLAFSYSLSAQSKPSDYKAPVKIKVEGDGGWDYIASDEETGLVYISHGTVVQVLDTKSGAVKATIPDTK